MSAEAEHLSAPKNCSSFDANNAADAGRHITAMADPPLYAALLLIEFSESSIRRTPGSSVSCDSDGGDDSDGGVELFLEGFTFCT